MLCKYVNIGTVKLFNKYYEARRVYGFKKDYKHNKVVDK